MSETRILGLMSDDRRRWSLALTLSVLLHVFVVGVGALLGHIVAGQPGNGACLALLFLLVLGPFAATYVAMRT